LHRCIDRCSQPLRQVDRDITCVRDQVHVQVAVKVIWNHSHDDVAEPSRGFDPGSGAVEPDIAGFV
jgi:hypothetical protein